MQAWVVDDTPGTRFPIWTRGNVGEVFPEVVNPLTWSLYGRAADEGWQDAFVEFGALERADYDPDHPSVVGVFGGYAYLNVSCTRLFAHRTPVVKVADIDRSIFGEQAAPPWVAPPGSRRLGRSLAALRSLLRSVSTTSPPPGVAADAAEVDAWRASLPDEATCSDEELVARLRDFGPRFRRLFARHILVSFQASVATSLVGQLVGDESLVPALVAGIGDIESAAPSTALWALGRMAPGSPEFDDAFAAFIASYGYRGPNEWDVGATTWDASPAGAMAAIGSLRKADPSHDPAGQRARLESERSAALAAALAKMRFWNRGRFRKAVAAATVLARSRETTKSTVIRALHGTRLAARELARRGGDPDRFFLLTVDELPAYLTDPASFASTLADRAAFREQLAALVPPFVFDRVQPDHTVWERRDAPVATVAAGTTLQGIGACPGVATGRTAWCSTRSTPKGSDRATCSSPRSPTRRGRRCSSPPRASSSTSVRR